MRIISMLLTAALLIGCETMPVNKKWEEVGLPAPDLKCSAYFDVDHYKDYLLFLYTRPPHSGVILFKDGYTVHAKYAREGQDQVWRWGTDERTGRYAYAISVAPNTQSYYFDWTTSDPDTTTLSAGPTYTCVPIR